MTTPAIVRGSVAIADPNIPANVIKPNADGSVNTGILNAGGANKVTLYDALGVAIDFSGITTVFRLLTTLNTTNSNLVKNAAGRYYWIRGRNNRASSVFIKIYNKASAPTVGTDTPIDTFEAVASQPFVLDFPIGMACSLGIGFGFTTVAADADTTAVAVGDITAFSMGYA